MKSFLQGKLASLKVGNGLLKLIERAALGVAKEENLASVAPQKLKRLRSASIITSSVSSCEIEGIDVSPEHAEAVLRKLRSPENRPEKELLNYKAALDYIYGLDPEEIRINPAFIRDIHRLVMDDAFDAGEYKNLDNVIREESAHGIRVRFKPVSTHDVPRYMSSLCEAYNKTLQKEESLPLLAIGALALDLTCIHPFSDGNGRVSRVVTTAAMLSRGMQMPKLVSMEEIISHQSEHYYRSLELSSEGWHAGEHRLEPFLEFHLTTVCQGYKDLQSKTLRMESPLTLQMSNSLPENVRSATFAAFSDAYENTVLELKDEEAIGVPVKIAELETAPVGDGNKDLKRAQTFAEQLLLESRRKAMKAEAADTAQRIGQDGHETRNAGTGWRKKEDSSNLPPL